jgi:[ribosomal protein S18]-alanine N-acetyltransferase
LQKDLSSDLTIRAMGESDFDEILAIEKKSFADPWSQRLFKETLLFPHSANFVLVSPRGEIVGYLNLYLIAQEGHLLNLAIHPAWRRQGLATAILSYTIEHLRQRQALHVFLEVREKNQSAIGLYRKLGFEVVGKRKRYYAETNEDALVMHLACKA